MALVGLIVTPRVAVSVEINSRGLSATEALYINTLDNEISFTERIITAARGDHARLCKVHRLHRPECRQFQRVCDPPSE